MGKNIFYILTILVSIHVFAQTSTTNNNFFKIDIPAEFSISGKIISQLTDNNGLVVSGNGYYGQTYIFGEAGRSESLMPFSLLRRVEKCSDSGYFSSDFYLCDKLYTHPAISKNELHKYSIFGKYYDIFGSIQNSYNFKWSINKAPSLDVFIDRNNMNIYYKPGFPENNYPGLTNKDLRLSYGEMNFVYTFLTDWAIFRSIAANNYGQGAVYVIGDPMVSGSNTFSVHKFDADGNISLLETFNTDSNTYYVPSGIFINDLGTVFMHYYSQADGTDNIVAYLLDGSKKLILSKKQSEIRSKFIQPTEISSPTNPEGLLYYLSGDSKKILDSNQNVIIDLDIFNSINKQSIDLISEFEVNDIGDVIWIGVDFDKGRMIFVNDHAEPLVQTGVQFYTLFSVRINNNNKFAFVGIINSFDASGNYERGYYLGNYTGGWRKKHCKVSDIKNKPVKFFSQGGGHWGNHDYAHGPANNQTTCKMKSFGCVTTSLAMLFDFYGLNYVAPEINGPPEEFSPGYLNRLFKSTKDLNNQVLKTYTYAPNNRNDHNNVDSLVVPNVGRSIHSKKCFEEKKLSGIKDTSAAKAECIKNSEAKISLIQQLYEWQTTPTNLNQAAKDVGFKKIENEICKGNPVLLRVAREEVNTRTRRLELRKHTVIVTESFYDEDEKLSFVVNDPSVSNIDYAENKSLQYLATRLPNQGKQYKHVIGYTIYRQTADPTMISIFSSPNVDFILTDKLGRRAGFSPISNTFYSEIPNASYINESIDNADEDPLAEANLPNQNNLIITEDVQDGEYQITLFGKDSGIADVQITKTDSAGFINDTEAFSSPVTSGSTQIFKFNHTSAPLPMVNDDLVINYAQYELVRTHDQYNSNSLDKPWQEIKPDKIKIYGDLKLPMGLKATCADSFTFKVGPSNEFNQTLNLSMFKQKSLSGNLFYEYSTDDLKIVVSEGGLFWIEIKRIDLDSINASKWGQIYVGLNNNLGRVDLNLNCKDRICYGEKIE